MFISGRIRCHGSLGGIIEIGCSRVGLILSSQFGGRRGIHETYIHAMMHACMYACMHDMHAWHMHTCMPACLHTCTHACIHAYMHARMHAHMHSCAHAYLYTCIHACMHTCIHAYMYTCIHSCILAYMQTCIHAYMHTRSAESQDGGEGKGSTAQADAFPFRAAVLLEKTGYNRL